VSFSVPTGNFGDIFAGYAAKKMGVPIDRLIVATNTNDILARTLASGRYEPRGVTPTASPSMDIQISSNFERLLFEASGRDSRMVRRLMDDLARTGGFTVPAATLAAIRTDFSAGRADEQETASAIADVFRATGWLPDPHTAVGFFVASNFLDPMVPMVMLATAHPAKFPDAVEAASGERPQLPEGFRGIDKKRERVTALANDRQAVEDFIARHARRVAEEV
jgi:threonine synthase